MKFEANKEFMGNLSLQFGQTTDGGTKFTCGRQSGMDGWMLDEGSYNLHADTSFSGPFVVQGRILRFGECASHDIRLYYFKKQIDKLNCISEIYIHSLRILFSPESLFLGHSLSYVPSTYLCYFPAPSTSDNLESRHFFASF